MRIAFATFIGAGLLVALGSKFMVGARPAPAFVVVDVGGEGVETCPRTVRSEIGTPDGPVRVVRWTCLGTDDAVLLLANPGRPAGTADVLGIKTGPPNGIDFLSLFGRRLGDPRSELNAKEPWFPFLILWRDSNQDLAVQGDELESLVHAGFDRILLPGPGSAGTEAGIVPGAVAFKAGRSHRLVVVPFGG
jgi:hypothetical protein